jgi:hypothetical protein
MVRALLCACGLLLPLSAFAFNGADLDQLCSRTDAVSMGACAGYIEGAADGEFNTIEAIGGTSGPKVGQYFCLPPDVASAQLTTAVRTFITKNPDKLGYNGSTVVALGLGASYPCGPGVTP